ncbi:MAG: hypothetical protein RI563_10375 [Thiohalophilus sp.]|uniref:hypothetical protein n=1 Tax=Thiohalophilus sp. TaxID=3028392 RepID=UPI0028707A4B|nr:hypothetical protein [Thiohalophilus sp.]MDR9437280.1 hypothetical protein [Thiohalophilus sp.]
MSIVEIDLNALADVVTEVTAALDQAYDDNPIEHSELERPQVIGENLKQFAQMVQHVDAQYHGTSDGKSREALPDKLQDLSQLGDYGLAQLADLSEWAGLLELEELQVTLDELSIPIALWTARNIGSLQELRNVVDALSRIANQTQDPDFLAELSGIMDEIANAAAPQVKADEDKSHAGRPWRMLNLNHGIVATRTHDPAIMESVFEQILLRLPEDAPTFFREGIEQVEAIDYPGHVREVMEKYYQMTNNPTLH